MRNASPLSKAVALNERKNKTEFVIGTLKDREFLKDPIELMENGTSNWNAEIDQTNEELSSVRREIAGDLNRLNDQVRAKIKCSSRISL